MKTVTTRAVLVAVFLPILFWAFLSELIRGFYQSFGYAFLEVRCEISSFPRLWKEAGDL